MDGRRDSEHSVLAFMRHGRGAGRCARRLQLHARPAPQLPHRRSPGLARDPQQRRRHLRRQRPGNVGSLATAPGGSWPSALNHLTLPPSRAWSLCSRLRRDRGGTPLGACSLPAAASGSGLGPRSAHASRCPGWMSADRSADRSGRRQLRASSASLAPAGATPTGSTAASGPTRPPAAARRRPRPVGGGRSRVRLDRRRLAGTAAGRPRPLRAARRHLHPGGDVRRRSSPRLPPCASWASRPSRSCRWPSSPATRNWGYDGVSPLRASTSYGGPHGLQRLVDACHAARPRGVPRRGLQPPRPGGQLPRPVRPVLHRPLPHALGRRRSTYDGAGQRRRPRATSSDNVRACGSRLPRRRPAPRRGHAIFDFGPRHLLRRARRQPPGAGSGRGGRPRAPDRRERPERPARGPAARAGGGYGLDAQWSDDFHHASTRS